MEKEPALNKQVGGLHYKQFAIEPIEFIVTNNIPFCEANVIKYLCRSHYKDGVRDLEKAKHYIEFIVELDKYNNIRFAIAEITLTEFATVNKLPEKVGDILQLILNKKRTEDDMCKAIDMIDDMIELESD
jgi:hypothetical protein